MKRINFTLIIVFMATLAFSQNAKKVKPGNGNGTDQFTVSLTCENHYISGTTMDLNFILDYQTTDWEYGDFISLTFPVGITPNSSPTDPFCPTLEGQDPEWLNGVSGQTISWGEDNDDGWGGIEFGEHPFIVNVTIDAGVTGDQVIDILVSGCVYGVPQGDVYFTYTLQEMPTTPDLAVVATGIDYTNYPLAQAYSIPVSAEVSNYGTELNTATDLVATCGIASYAETAAIFLPLPNGGSETLTLPVLNPFTEGTHEIIIEANAPGDPYLSNNSDTITFGVDSVYAHDDGGRMFAYGSNYYSYSIGIIYDIIIDDDLTGVQFFLAETATIGDEFSLSVCPVTTSGETFTCGDPVWESEALYVDATMLESWSTVNLQNAELLEGGEYALFIHEHTSSSIEIGHDGNNQGDILLSVNGINNYWEDETYGWAMLRLVLGASNTVLLDNDVSVSAIVSPNSDINLSNAETVTITITNYGVNPQTDFDVAYTVDGAGEVVETISGTLNGGESMDYTFTTQVDLSAIGTYAIEACTMLADDENPGNDCKTKDVVNAEPALCVPQYSTGCSYGDGFTDFALEQIENYGTACADLNGLGWSQYLNLDPAILSAGETYIVTMASGYGSNYASIWIDFNDDLDLTEDEQVLFSYLLPAAGVMADVEITIPADAPEGQHIMRARTNYNADCLDACEEYMYGEAEDYYINIGEAPPPPTDLTATVIDYDVELNWQEAAGSGSSTFIGYRVYRDGAAIAEEIAETSYTDYNLLPGTYSYNVKGVYEEGVSAGAGPVEVIIEGGVERDLVIIEVATGTWCTYCPGAAMGVDEMHAEGLSVGIIEYHSGDNYETTESSARIAYYGVTGFPTAVFDGVDMHVGGDATQSLYATYLPKYESRIGYASVFTIDAEYYNIGGDNYQVSIDAEMIATYTWLTNDIVLQVALTESHIPENWLGQTEVNFVCRDMIPTADGTSLDFAGNATQTVTLDFTIPSSYVMENVEIIVFIQDNTTKEILQGSASMFQNSDEMLSLIYEGEAFESGETITVDSSETVAEIVAHMAIQNNYSTAKDILVSKEVISETEGHSNTFCWGLCFPPNIIVSPDAITLEAGEIDEEDFSGHLMPNGFSGTTVIKYTFFEEDNPDVEAHFFVEFVAGEIGKLQGFIRDAETNLSIDAAMISAINTDDETYTYETPFGAHYHLLLPEGIYSVSCTSDGYETGVLENVEIIAGENVNHTFYLEPSKILTGINDTDKNGISVYPNPAHEEFHIDGVGIHSVLILNYRGQVVYQNDEPQTNNIIQTGDMPSGIYILKVETERALRVEKIVIEK